MIAEFLFIKIIKYISTGMLIQAIKISNNIIKQKTKGIYILNNYILFKIINFNIKLFNSIFELYKSLYNN